MSLSRCIPQFVALSAMLALAGCGSIGLFGKYNLPESPEVASAPWPRLVDTPVAPPVGSYTPAVPDPAQGALAQSELGAAATAANVRAAELARPVITDAERAAMLAAARRAR